MARESFWIPRPHSLPPPLCLWPTLCLSRWAGISFFLKSPQRTKSSSFLVVIFRVSHPPWGFALTWTYKTPRNSPKTSASIHMAKTPLTDWSPQIHSWIHLGIHFCIKLSFWVRNYGCLAVHLMYQHPNLVVREWLRNDTLEPGIFNCGSQGPHWNNPDIVKKSTNAQCTCFFYLWWYSQLSFQGIKKFFCLKQSLNWNQGRLLNSWGPCKMKMWGLFPKK